MRVLLLALMIALLPLRGWVGDAMAMEMVAATLQQPEIAMNSVASHADMARETTPFETRHEAMVHADCPGHAATASGSDTPAGSQHLADAADCATCAACQICHTVALTPIPLQMASAALPTVQPQSSSHHFASAERAPGFKPPIF